LEVEPCHSGPSGSGASELPFCTLLYRYFFFGWLFRDASAGSFLERAAARQFNRERRIHLPTYLRRWLGLVVLSYALGALVESQLAPGVAAGLCYGVTTISLAITACIARSWLLLKYG
jgi:hypothetical protein